MKPILLILVGLLAGCVEEELPTNPNRSNPALVWAVKMGYETIGISCSSPYDYTCELHLKDTPNPVVLKCQDSRCWMMKP